MAEQHRIPRTPAATPGNDDARTDQSSSATRQPAMSPPPTSTDKKVRFSLPVKLQTNSFFGSRTRAGKASPDAITPQASLDELGYTDKDHSIAHGQVDQAGPSSRNQLQRNRTLTSVYDKVTTKSTDEFREIVETNKEKHRRRRRTSHDITTQTGGRKFLIDVEETTKLILAQEDTDGDFQITVQDQGPKTFVLGSANSDGHMKYEIRGHYMISNLLQELALACDYGRKHIILEESRLNENPVERLTRLIKFHFWDGLTRRIDAEGLEAICQDPKNRSSDQRYRIYVPFYDDTALEYFTGVAVSKPHLNLDVVRLPETITPQYVKSLNEHPGILTLALKPYTRTSTGATILRGVPFVVPGGRFNEQYGWDSYFENLGLLADGRVELAKSMTDNFFYQIEHYGKILNANRSYYLTRSQPPFLCDMAIQVYRNLLLNPQKYSPDETKRWLRQAVNACIKDLLSVWLSHPRLDSRVGLVKYHPEGIGMPPETESSHFNHVLEPFAKKFGISDVEEFKKLYDDGKILVPELDRYFVHDRAVRESGHDTTYRLEHHCADLATIDLNSLVFRYMKDLGQLIKDEFGGEFVFRIRRGPDDVFVNALRKFEENLVGSEFDLSEVIGSEKSFEEGGWDCFWARGVFVHDKRFPGDDRHDFGGDPNKYCSHKVDDADPHFAVVRVTSVMFEDLTRVFRERIFKYCWNPTAGLFYDFNCHTMEQSGYDTVTSLWTAWAGLFDEDNTDAAVLDRSIKAALEKFEVKGGLVSGTEESRGEISLDRPNRQWDYPFGWAPHQIMAWEGLRRCGYEKEASRLAYRWLFTITKAFVDFNGVVPEKFDVVSLSHQVKVEYGNVGTDFKYINREGFGWMNASFEVGLAYLTRRLKRALGTLTDPEKIL